MKILGVDARRLYDKLRKEWGISDEAGKLLLQTAMEAYGEMKAAQQTLATEGTYIDDRFQQRRLHPAAQREKEARAHMLMALKQLNLNLDTLEAK